VKKLAKFVSELKEVWRQMPDAEMLNSIAQILETAFPALAKVEVDDISPPAMQVILAANFDKIATGLAYLSAKDGTFLLNDQPIEYGNLWEFGLADYPELCFLEKVSGLIEHLPTRDRYAMIFETDIERLIQLAEQFPERRRHEASPRSKLQGRRYTREDV